ATAANADNGQPGVGAFWSYNNLVGSDSALSPGETSATKNLRFSDSGGPFSVTFNVVGNLARSTQSSSPGSSWSGGAAGGGSASSGTSSPTGTVTGLMSAVRYIPCMIALSVNVLRP